MKLLKWLVHTFYYAWILVIELNKIVNSLVQLKFSQTKI
jgi:hypothetical protein